MGFLTLWLVGKLRCFDGSMHPSRFVLALLPLGFAVWVGITRLQVVLMPPLQVAYALLIPASLASWPPFVYCILHDSRAAQDQLYFKSWLHYAHGSARQRETPGHMLWLAGVISRNRISPSPQCYLALAGLQSWYSAHIMHLNAAARTELVLHACRITGITGRMCVRALCLAYLWPISSTGSSFLRSQMPGLATPCSHN